MPSYSVEGLLCTQFTDSLNWGAPNPTPRRHSAGMGAQSDHPLSLLCCSRSTASGGHVPRRRQRADGRLDHGWSPGGPQSWRPRTRRRMEGDGGHILRPDQGSSIGASGTPRYPTPPRVQSEGSAVLLSSAARLQCVKSGRSVLVVQRLFEPEAGSPPSNRGLHTVASACASFTHALLNRRLLSTCWGRHHSPTACSLGDAAVPETDRRDGV